MVHFIPNEHLLHQASQGIAAFYKTIFVFCLLIKPMDCQMQLALRLIGAGMRKPCVKLSVIYASGNLTQPFNTRQHLQATWRQRTALHATGPLW